MQLTVLLSQAVYWGKIFFPFVSMFSPCIHVFPLAMLYGIYFTFLPRQPLGYELEEKQYNIFPPGPVLFLLVTEKLIKKINGGKKNGIIFPFPYFPLGPCCIWFPFSDSYGIEIHENDDFYPWLKCTLLCV
jgi:hypothetical protein